MKSYEQSVIISRVVDLLGPLTTHERCGVLRKLIEYRPHWFAANSVQESLQPDNLKRFAEAQEG